MGVCKFAAFFLVEIVGSDASVFENLQLTIENLFANLSLLLICK